VAGLILEEVHAALGARFVAALGLRLPGAYGDDDESLRVRESVGLFDRSYRGILDLSGPDLPKTLDGLFTSAASRLAAGSAEPSCFLSPRGKIVGAFRLHHLPDGTFRLLFGEPLRGAFVATLGKYALLGDVVLEDRSRDLGILSLEGPRAGETLAALAGAGSLPGEPGLLREAAILDVPVKTLRGGASPEGGFEVWVPAGSLAAVWEGLLAAARERGGGPVGHEAAEVLRIEAGIGRFGKDFDEESFPGEAGWASALTFHKCYIGQEIMARMRTYGHVNRKLMAVLPLSVSESARSEGPLSDGGRIPLAVGAALRVGGEDAGTVTSVGISTRLGGVVALALVHRRFWDAREAEVVPGRTGLRARLVGLPPVAVDRAVSAAATAPDSGPVDEARIA
jgi:folate-binding protein YgfZ